MCANKSADLTQIGGFLDWAKEYTENHLRQYRYKINTIISKNVVEYKNGIYSLVGEIKESDKLAIGDRNTDLLQQTLLQSKKANKPIKMMKFIKFPAIVAIIILLLPFFSWAYGFYTFLRIIITGVSIYYAYYFYSKKAMGGWFWILLAVAILFNPIAPIYIKDKGIWQIIDMGVSVFFASLIYRFRKNE